MTAIEISVGNVCMRQSYRKVKGKPRLRAYFCRVKSLWTLNRYFWRYRWRFAIGFFCVGTAATFAVFPAVFIRRAFDEVAVAMTEIGLAGSMASEPLKKALLIYSLVILGMSVMKGLFTFLMRQTLIVMSRLIEADLKDDIYAHYQSLDQAFYLRNSTGDLMNRISEDVSRVRMYLGPALMYSINMLFSLTLTLSFMFSVDVKLSVMTLAPMPLIVWSIYRVSKLINQRSTAVQAQQSAISTLAQETFSGIRVLKSFALEKGQSERHLISANASFARNEGLYRVNALFMPLMLLLVGVSTAIAVWVGGQGVVDGRLTPGVIAEFVFYVGLLTWPIASMGWVVSLTQRAAASMQRINDFLQAEPSVASEADTIAPSVIQGALVVDKVSLTYESGIEALKEVSFTIKAGETVVIVGRTGSGKTSLAHLLTRQMDPSKGQIAMDGLDIKQWPLNDLRHAIGMVPQDSFLFSDTVAENIAFGDANASREAIEKEAKLACVHDDIMGFTMNYDTVVGERGVTLSGGQKQRICIARAMMKQPALMVFDDALSAVDSETESQLLEGLKSRLKGLTSIIITQRLNAVHQADQILVMDAGQLVQSGKHRDLMQEEGLYADLYRLQNPIDSSTPS
jgi:ATP-binding cassette subfamily B multidrug efflux pump